MVEIGWGGGSEARIESLPGHWEMRLGEAGGVAQKMTLGRLESGLFGEIAEQFETEGDREAAAPWQPVATDILAIDQGVLELSQLVGFERAREILLGQVFVPVHGFLITGRIGAEGGVVEVGSVVNRIG